MKQEKVIPLIEDALEALHDKVFNDKIILHKAQHGGYHQLEFKGLCHVNIVAKRWAQHYPASKIIEAVENCRLESSDLPCILVAEYINPKLADRLIEAEIYFMDTFGNCYFHLGNCHSMILRNRPQMNALPDMPNHKLYEKSGLRLMSVLLMNPKLLKATIRKLAKAAGISVGSATKYSRMMIEFGTIVDGKLMIDLFLDQWSQSYVTKCLPPLELGVFVAKDLEGFLEQDMTDIGVIWSGEYAASHYTKNLNFKSLSAYVPEENRKEFIMKGKLRKATSPLEPNAITLYHRFWDPDLVKNDRFLHPYLVYAELINSQDGRLFEVGKQLLEDDVLRYFKQS